MPAPFQPYIATVAGAVEFTGAAAADGLCEFTDWTPGGNVNRDIRAVIHSISYDGGGPLTLLVILRLVGGAATERQVLIDAGGINSRVLAGCNIIVPKEPIPSGVTWDLVCTTVGKSGTGSLIVDWSISRGGC